MPVVEVKPFVIHNAIIQFDTDDFAKAVQTATLTPSGSNVNFYGQKPDAVFTFPTSTTWALELTYAQDWSVEDSLSRYLWDHAGETISATLNPDDSTTGGTTVWALDVVITEGAVGGDVNTVATASVSLGVVGRPVPTFAPATP